MSAGRCAGFLAVLLLAQGLCAGPDQLAWDATAKEQQAKDGVAEAGFFFIATNVSSSNAVIERVQTSCGCTVARIPSQPWILKPGESGKLNATVDLRGKYGTLSKAVTVYFDDQSSQILGLKITVPDTPQMQRMRNQQLAAMDRQLVFKDDGCAHCHADPTHGKTGKDLYLTACGICHESEHRATMVPNLYALRHPTDKVYWRQWITSGKPGTLMPGFGTQLGGPLSSDQIDSLVDYLSGSVIQFGEGDFNTKGTKVTK
jgi:mono/diheme cytochrome c family protein